jgi:hypothetical protein
MKYTNRHGLLWDKVDRIQSAPDMRQIIRTETPKSRDQYELKNSYRS